MITREYNIQAEGSLPYAKLKVYLWEKSPEIQIKNRPLILICPGGGYEFTSDREADPLATQFLAMGYQVAILRYSVAPAEYPVALLEAFTAIKMIRENADEWCVEAEKLFVLGCSAGGHLAASVGMFWNKKWIAEKLGCTNEQLKPAVMAFPPAMSWQRLRMDMVYRKSARAGCHWFIHGCRG